MFHPQTHFDYSNYWSEVRSFCVISISFSYFYSWTPCKKGFFWKTLSRFLEFKVVSFVIDNESKKFFSRDITLKARIFFREIFLRQKNSCLLVHVYIECIGIFPDYITSQLQKVNFTKVFRKPQKSMYVHIKHVC